MIPNVPSPITITGAFKQGWKRIKNAYLQKIKGVKEVAASDFDSAYAKAKSHGMKKFFWQGECYNTAYDGPLQEERKTYDVCNGSKIAGKRIPQGEKPIKIYIYPFGGDTFGYTSHAAMEYDGAFLSYGSHGNFEGNADSNDVKCYEVYPSLIDDFRLQPEKIKPAMESLAQNADWRSGEAYNFFTNNCADQVQQVLEAAGAVGIHRTAGVANPSEIAAWCEQYGHRVTPQQAQVADFHYWDYLCDLQKHVKQDRSPESLLKDKNVDLLKAELSQTANFPEYTEEMLNNIKAFFPEEAYVLQQSGVNDIIRKTRYFADKGESALIKAQPSEALLTKFELWRVEQEQQKFTQQEKDNMKRQQGEERQQRLQNTMQKAHERLQEMRKKIQIRQQEREASAANSQGAENMALFSQRLQRQNAMLRLQLQEKLQKLGR